MSKDSNPYDSSTSSADTEPSTNHRTPGGFYAVGMIFIPIAVAIATGIFGGLLKQQWLPQIDERYISLFIGIPWTVAAWLLALICWRRGHRAIAVTGCIFWTVCGVFAAWITIGFWHG